MSSTLHFFTIPALAPVAAQAELNGFLAAHRVVALERQWLSAGVDSAWAVCVTVANGQAPLPAALKMSAIRGERPDKVDYRDILSPADFAVFATLRELRKNLSAKDGVPPYALFANEQLASMARQRPDSAQALRDIDGLGEARIGKYGAAFLAALQGIDHEAADYQF